MAILQHILDLTQKIVSEISSSFVSVDQSTLDKRIYSMLEKTGAFFAVDKTYVVVLDREKATINYALEWCGPGIKSSFRKYLDRLADDMPWLLKRLEAEEPIIVEDTDVAPTAKGQIKKYIADNGIKSLVLIPVEGDEDEIGFIGLDSVSAHKKWSDYHVGLLKILSNLLTDCFGKIKNEKEIEYMAYYDQLTALPNRIFFSERLNRAIGFAKKNNALLGVVFIDLDSFKTINDNMGHKGGDAVIKAVAQHIQKNVGETNMVARFGGDEFLILVNGQKEKKDVVQKVDDVMKVFREPFCLDGQNFYVTGSAGIAIYPYDGEDAGTLIKNADMAMYSAKINGKNQYVSCTEEMKKEAEKNIVLSNDLRYALENDELLLYYQPQIHLKTGEIMGLEALIRWNHAKLGMIPPSVFIPLAEKNGLINGIGQWVMKTAVRQNKRWQDMGLAPLRVAVNLSALEFQNPFIADVVDKTLKEAGLDPRFLELEITETIAIKDSPDTVHTFNKLKNLGVTISIDDFGVAYSPLGRLKQLPIDRIKIDMQFVQAIENSRKDKAITKVIINLAKSLKLQVLAEGVETQSQLDFLSKRMCDGAQGYYFYKPMPLEQVEGLLAETNHLPPRN